MAQILAPSSPQCQMRVPRNSAVASSLSSKMINTLLMKQKKAGKVRSSDKFRVLTVKAVNNTVIRVEDLLNLDTKPYIDKIIAEYIWVGGSEIDLRSKSRTISTPVEDTSELPKWDYDGSSTSQAPGESFNISFQKGQNAARNSLDSVMSALTSIKKTTSEAVDGAINTVLSNLDQKRVLAGDKLTSFSSDLKGVSNEATAIAINLLRQIVAKAENTVTDGVSFISYSYRSTKDLASPDIRSILDLSEDRVAKVLMPVVTTFQKLYTTFEGLEKGLGVDPDDPITHLILYLASLLTIWILYQLWAYGGYAGNLSPNSALELLNAKEKSVLIDIRPEDLRERDGIPGLRRTARFRYSSVSLPEVDDPMKKILKSGRALDDSLIAVVVKNLKVVKDRSKVIILDADGTRSKGVARALRKLGVKRSYVVSGGFKSWIKDGLRIKTLKLETALTVLNEEAEAILEEIRPSNFQVVGASLGFVAAVYALIEWEKTLQFVGLVGLSQTIYRRVASYENSEDLKQDVRRLLLPVKLSAQAFSWVAGKLETNGLGLPTSPSSSDVQSRVLQAAAKHEPQPVDADSAQDSTQGSDNVDLSEA